MLEFAFLAENSGTRPAADALVMIEARGGFEIRPPPFEDTDEDREGEDDASGSLESGALRPPPVAPRGRWKNTVGGQPGDVLRALDLFGRSLQDISGIAYPDPDILSRPLAFPSLNRPDPRDPNAFYYKPGRPAEPQASFSLECAQWRHDNEAEPFIGEIHVPTDRDAAEGLLVCRIQAANLSKSVSCRIPVRIANSAFQRLRKCPPHGGSPGRHPRVPVTIPLAWYAHERRGRDASSSACTSFRCHKGTRLVHLQARDVSPPARRSARARPPQRTPERRVCSPDSVSDRPA